MCAGNGALTRLRPSPLSPPAEPRFYPTSQQRWLKTVPFVSASGWVCENHADRAWSDELGCMCGAGMPYKCNRTNEPDTSQVIEELPTTRQSTRASYLVGSFNK